MDFCAYVLEPTEFHLRCSFPFKINIQKFKGFFFFLSRATARTCNNQQCNVVFLHFTMKLLIHKGNFCMKMLLFFYSSILDERMSSSLYIPEGIIVFLKAALYNVI